VTAEPGSPPSAEIPIDEELVRRLLLEQCPDLADLDLSWAAEGWDNVTFRLGSRLAVRLPRRARSADLIGHEQRWLPQIAEHLSLPIPAPVRSGRPVDAYPWRWSVVPWFEGTSALEAPLLAGEASRLGSFLAELHAITVPPDAPSNPFRGIPLRTRSDVIRERLSRAAAALSTPAAAEAADLLEQCFLTPVDAAPTWLHGDLHSKNIVSLQGRMTAVVDWGDICSGDPATDLAASWILFRPEDHKELWSAYGAISAGTILRARGWAIAFGSMLWESHHRADAAFAEMGLETIRRAIAAG
jgi:aminoglycoside phosphotransferase (APT) family kinase protein